MNSITSIRKELMMPSLANIVNLKKTYKNAQELDVIIWEQARKIAKVTLIAQIAPLVGEDRI